MWIPVTKASDWSTAIFSFHAVVCVGPMPTGITTIDPWFSFECTVQNDWAPGEWLCHELTSTVTGESETIALAFHNPGWCMTHLTVYPFVNLMDIVDTLLSARYAVFSASSSIADGSSVSLGKYILMSSTLCGSPVSLPFMNWQLPYDNSVYVEASWTDFLEGLGYYALIVATEVVTGMLAKKATSLITSAAKSVIAKVTETAAEDMVETVAEDVVEKAATTALEDAAEDALETVASDALEEVTETVAKDAAEVVTEDATATATREVLDDLVREESEALAGHIENTRGVLKGLEITLADEGTGLTKEAAETAAAAASKLEQDLGEIGTRDLTEEVVLADLETTMEKFANLLKGIESDSMGADLDVLFKDVMEDAWQQTANTNASSDLIKAGLTQIAEGGTEDVLDAVGSDVAGDVLGDLGGSLASDGGGDIAQQALTKEAVLDNFGPIFKQVLKDFGKGPSLITGVTMTNWGLLKVAKYEIVEWLDD